MWSQRIVLVTSFSQADEINSSCGEFSRIDKVIEKFIKKNFLQTISNVIALQHLNTIIMSFLIILGFKQPKGRSGQRQTLDTVYKIKSFNTFCFILPSLSNFLCMSKRFS